MALDGVLSTGSAYAQVPSGTVGTLAYAANDATAETSGAKADTGTAAGAASGGEAGPRLSAPAYISPVVTYDSQAAIAITQFRDSVTGAVDYQIPSRQVVEQYRLRATGAARYQGGNSRLAAEVDAPSNDQSGTGTAAAPASGGTGSSGGGTGAALSSGSTGGSGSALISATVAAVTLGAAAVNVMA
ncbi:hypothetical protein [Nitrospirillum sp. BR 11828]|uniref:hypothetical protein n=1 Tax=Nitrospirillum sp. BR 11828 TaxID=3104325 RepID=UPI002ACAE477|nr:hypothetical protein [Nitrospirillum sp. BR 11828]MDZ5649247.1 hypothetical protein [Nitrospirillum sp. BR 11828]